MLCMVAQIQAHTHIIQCLIAVENLSHTKQKFLIQKSNDDAHLI